MSSFTSRSWAGRTDHAALVAEVIGNGSGMTEAARKVLENRISRSGRKVKQSSAGALLSPRCLTFTSKRWSQLWGRIDYDEFPMAAWGSIGSANWLSCSEVVPHRLSSLHEMIDP